MGEYKYPYVPKDFYPAVMFACKMLEEKFEFDTAIARAAEYYKVDTAELTEHVQKRQAAENQKMKYSYFAVEFSLGVEQDGCDHFQRNKAQYMVKRGLTKNTVKRSMSSGDNAYSKYSPQHYFGRIEQFETKEEAEKKVREWQRYSKSKKA